MRVLGINAVLPAQLAATFDDDPSPSSIVVADDRRDATSALDLSASRWLSSVRTDEGQRLR
jgi:hypothetical protein